MMAQRSCWRSAVLALALALAGCAAPAAVPAEPTAAPRTLDLSHVVREDMPVGAGEAAPRLERGPDGGLRTLTLGAQTGSLLRVALAPGAAPVDVESLSPRELVLPAVVIDARDQAQDRPGFSLSAGDVLAWEQRHGPVPAGALVLLATGWDVRWGDAGAYGGAGGAGAPGFGADAADLLVNQRGALALGLDAPGAAFVPADGFCLLLENLTRLEQLPPTGATVVIGALKLQRAQSSPARVLALIP